MYVDNTFYHVSKLKLFNVGKISFPNSATVILIHVNTKKPHACWYKQQILHDSVSDNMLSGAMQGSHPLQRHPPRLQSNIGSVWFGSGLFGPSNFGFGSGMGRLVPFKLVVPGLYVIDKVYVHYM